MKKRWAITILLVITLAFSALAAACGKSNAENPAPSPDLPSVENCKMIEIAVNSSDVTLVEENAVGYDYTVFFTVYGDGNRYATKAEYINSSAVKAEVGTYKVYCTVKDQTAEITVHVNSSAPVSVTALSDEVDLKDDELADYNFASLFRVSLSGETVELENKDIDLTGLKNQRGTYVISCTYKGKRATVRINVTEAVYKAALAQDSVKIHVSQVADYDFGSLFSASREGEPFTVTNSMLGGEVKAEAGEYALTFARGGVSLTLNVTVSAADVYIAHAAYSCLLLPEAEAKSRDYVSDFYLYKNGAAAEVTADMIDDSAVTNAKLGDVCLVKLTVGGEVTNLRVKIIEDNVIITARNAEAFINGANVAPTSLFEITRDGKPVSVTYDMLSGEVDYSVGGDYTVTLNYEGRVATATVTVKNGVIIDYARSSEVIIKSGTPKATYDFSADFKVSVNGVEFSDLSSYLIGVDDVNFDIVGSYSVTLKLSYNEKSFGLSGVKFTYPEKTVTYQVVRNEYTLTTEQSRVEIKKGTSFNALSNIKLVLNGLPQTLTADRSNANGYTACYAEVKNGVNVNETGKTTVRVAVYVNGVTADPVYIEYDAVVIGNTEITAQNKVITVGYSLDITKLFTVTDEGMRIAVTPDMISGSFNPFALGSYDLTLEYKERQKTANVTVIDGGMIGTYKTSLLTIGSSATYDDEGLVVDDAVKSQQIGDMTISSDMAITVNGKSASDVSGVGAGDFRLTLERSNFILSYDNGVAVLVYDNYLRMKLTNVTRPIVYFNAAQWQIVDSFAINSAKSGKHVLEGDTANYSIDLFKVKNLIDGGYKWYGLKTYLYSHASSDYDYKITFGEAVFADGFEKTVGVTSAVTLLGETYGFRISSESKASVVDSESEQAYSGSFRGAINGVSATLNLAQTPTASLTVGTESLFSFSMYDLSGLGYNSSNVAEGTFTVHGAKIVTVNKAKNTQSVSYTTDLRAAVKAIKDTDEEKVEIYPFSYKFALNVQAKTFELIVKDEFFGLYTNKTASKYVFFNGYGLGVANYNLTSYEKVLFEYEKRGASAIISYLGESLTYGAGADVALNADGNTLTVLTAESGLTVGEGFESVSLNGAIVKVSSYTVKKGTSLSDFLSTITVITEDGELTAEQKKTAVYTSAIAFSTPGFYQFYVTVNVGGVNKKLYYGIQVIDKKYEGLAVVRTFERSFSGNSTLVIDEYGYLTLTSNGVKYSGNAVISADGTQFSATATTDAGEVYTFNGRLNNSLLHLEGTGIVKFSEYFAARSTDFAGNGELILRAVRTDSGYDYYASSSRTVLGESVTVSYISGTSFTSGAKIQITYASGRQVTVKIDEIGNETGGLTVIG